MEWFNLKKLNKVEGNEQFEVEISNRFAALENLTLRSILIELGKSLREYKNFSQRQFMLSF
jgi:hypothetical protein